MSNRTHNRSASRTARAFGFALMATAMLSACRGTTSPNPPVHLNPNMDNVTRIEAQEPSDFFQDGRGMRPQIEGTVAVGELRQDAWFDDGMMSETQWAEALPPQVPLTAELLERGQDRFEIYCTPCHGDAGLENGGVVPQRAAAIGNSWLVPSLHGDRQRGYTVGQLYDVISNGYNTMPSYRAQVRTEDRWAIAAYVRALQVSNEMPLSEVPREVRSAQGWR